MARYRLTESRLRGMIREAVKSALNEIEFGGESFHGDNAEDWLAMGKLRSLRRNGDLDYAEDIENDSDKLCSAMFDDQLGIERDLAHVDDLAPSWEEKWNAEAGATRKLNRMRERTGAKSQLGRW